MSRILAALASHATHHPERVAITGSRQSLSWRALADGVELLANSLEGVRTLGLLMKNSPGWVMADLAALTAGCVHIPLPDFFSDDQLRHAIIDAGVDTLITDDAVRIARLFPGCRRKVLSIAGQACVRIRLDHPLARDMQGIAKITYTSGTTGAPRGVCLSQQMMESVAADLAGAVQASDMDRALVLLPLPILLENIGSVYAPLLAGAQIIVPDPDQTGISGSGNPDPARLADVLARYLPTSLIVPPGLLKLLLVLARTGAMPGSLRFIAVGGAPVGAELLHEAQRLGLPVYQGYGLSEAASVIAVNTPQQNRVGSVGKPLPHCRVHISDAGEILVHGIAGTGYLNDANRNEGPELATGDLGYLDDDGFLYVTGRIRNRIITPYGRNVSPEWIESELLSHPDILQAAVFGNELPTLVAVLVARQGIQPDQLQQAVDTINARLPDYARIGQWVRADAPFSPASGELAPGGALRRDAVGQHYLCRFETSARKYYG
jgi:long-subunit acyl-CoA synthetase (AMP-forming)